ncbi:MAG TPA: alpha-amylase family glycosyl hydrolase [Ignavibacteriaceae bacterium]|nr:alpha-amylase family glycosyl hydrolase [Ignavibacteriaceae bacterium]
MKIKFIIILFAVLSEAGYSQIVTSAPTYPTENDSIVVYFDASQPGAEELLNYTGTLYVHTGVNTNLGDWQHVIGDWGQTNQPSLTRLDTNLYKLTIGHPRQFYGITDASEHISSLNFVFRSSDANSQTRPDIFYTIYQPGYTLALNSPSVSNTYGDPQRSPLFINSTDTVNISVNAVAIGTQNSSITLFVNGIQKVTTSSDSLKYQLMAANELSTGVNQVVITGNDNTSLTDTIKITLMINPAISLTSQPSGTELGVNYNSNSTTSVTLALFAPQKSFVYVIGDFNDWNVDQNYFMEKDSVSADSVVYWLTINGLVPGKEYAYQYLVNGNLRIADPFTHKVLDPWNDGYISSTIYPNLIKYPNGKTSEIVSVLQTDQQQYNWKITNFQKPDKSNLVVYELLVRDFVSTHWFKTVMDTLNYLKTLGVNAVEFMPVMEFEGNESWGYNVSFHLALDKYYGTPDAFKTLVDSAHSKGMAVLLDVVLNHAFGQNTLVRMYFSGYGTDQILTTPGNPYFNSISPNPTFHWGADFNHAKPATQYYVDRVTSYWINEYHIDGYRFDFSKGFTNTYGDGGSYDASRIAILERMASKIWAIDSTSILVLENFVDNNEEKVESNFGFLSWGNMNYNYNEATMGYNSPGHSDLRNAFYGYRGWPKPSLVTYMESHDEERLMYKNEAFGNSSPYFKVQDTTNALKRMELAGAFFFTIPGPKMIWQFGELGYDYSIDYNGRVGNKPIRWDYYNDSRRQRLYKVWAAETKLKANYPAFQNLDSMNVTDSLKTLHFSDTNMKVVVCGNFSVWQTTMKPYFQQQGMWYDYFTGDSVYISQTDTSITVKPGGYYIFTSVKLPTPNLDIISDVKSGNNTIVSDYNLSQNYPNPFNPSTVIKYQLPAPGNVTLKIYDILGREVKTLVNGYQQNGSYKITFDASKLASGIYFYQIHANNFVSTKKMILLK